MDENHYKYGPKIYNLAKDIFYHNRSITGDGVRKTLSRVKKILTKLKIYEIKSKKKVFDWYIPLEWNIKKAFIKKNKKVILDFNKNNLHIVGYSHYINKSLHLSELKKKIHFIKKIPDAIPYVVSYYKKDWGFVSYNKFKKFRKVHIKF